MKYLKYIKKAALAAMVCCLLIIGSTVPAYAAEAEKTYKTGDNITYQGENGFFYAWGTPDHYVLMEYGYGYSESILWHGLEGYSHITGSSIHPGSFWGSMVIWVAEESGQISLDGHMEKGGTAGDGVHLGVYRFSNGQKEVLLEEFVDGSGELKYELSKNIDVKKGDSFVFYCDSGKAKDNGSDSCGCPFTIKYLKRNGDKVKGEDLKQYLNISRTGDVGGFKHIDEPFAAEITDGTLTKKETKTGGCGASVATQIYGLGLLIITGTAVFFLKRRNAQ